VYIVALLIFVGELGIPTGIPAEIALLVAGSYGVHSFTGLVAAVVLVVAADMLGTITLHLVARTGGSRLLNKVMQRFGRRSEETVDRWRARMGGHDLVVVGVGRSLPLVRMYFSIGAGLLRIQFRDFVIGAVPGAMIWVGTPIVLGYYLHADVQRFAVEYATISHLIFMILPTLSLAAVAMWWVRRGHTRWSQLRRGRSVIGILIASAAFVILVRTLILHGELLVQGVEVVQHTVLTTWVIGLGAAALALLALSFNDLRITYRRRDWNQPANNEAAAELATTAIWLALVIGTGSIAILLITHYALF
jgi:membrane protein DedA with SNARE-associated domain